MKKGFLPARAVAVGYIRQSKLHSAMTDEDVLRLTNDRKLEIAQRAMQDERVIEKWYLDLDLSGQSIENRPAFQEMMQAARERRFTHVYAADLSRWFRKLKDQEVVYDDLEALGIKLLFAQEADIEDEDAARIYRQARGMANEFYARQIGKKIKARHLRNAEQGLWNGGSLPLGYDWDKENRRFIANEQAPTVRLVFALFAELKSVRAVGLSLNLQKVPAPSGGLWWGNTLRGLLKQPLYRGFYYRSGQLYPCDVEPIVPPEMLSRVDSLLHIRAFTANPKPATGQTYAFTGFLRCRFCQKALALHLAPPARKFRNYYRCTGRADRGGCPLPSLRENRLLIAVAEGILLLLLRQEESLRRAEVALPAENRKPVVSSEAQIKRLRETRRRLLLHLAGLDEQDSERTDTELLLVELNAEIRRLEVPEEPETETPTLPVSDLTVLHRLWQQFEKLPVDQQRSLMQRLTLRGETDGERLWLSTCLGNIVVRLPARRHRWPD